MEAHVWQPPSAPMQRIHVDFAGPFLGKMFLIMVDAYSKWPEMHVMMDITAKSTIAKCRQIFAAFGLPQVMVTDNGRTFTSHEFQQFVQANGIKHKLTAPYNPATNGQAERFVQTLKQALKRIKCDTSSINLALSQILLQYRSMTHAFTNKSPAEMFLGRRLYTRLDLLLTTEEENISSQNKFSRSLSCGERDACRNYSSEEKWKFGRIVEKLGKLHYKISLDDGRSWTRHINQIRSIGENTPTDYNSQNENYYWDSNEKYVENQNIVPRIAEAQVNAPVFPQSESDRALDISQQTPRRSNKIKKKPDCQYMYQSNFLF